MSGRDITTYEYDLQGSLLKEESADICRQYLYNDFHQCIQTDVIRGREESAERLVQENLYDGEGLRFAIIENGKRTGFITDGWNNVAEIDENGRVTKRIIRGMGIVVSEDTEQKEDNIFTTSYHYYHGNERMDVEYITDEAGNVVNSYTYDAFGGIISSNETIQNRYTYNGEAYDKTTEQYYLRKRYYNPKLCRFTQEDEYRGDGLNLYAFCANNPVMYVDPSGYKCETGAEADSAEIEANKQNSENVIVDRQILTGEEWYQYFKEQYGAENVQGSAYNWSQAELQSAMDEIYLASKETASSWNGGPRQTITITQDGLVIISQNSSKVNFESQLIANRIFGDDVIPVNNSVNDKRPNMPENFGNHAETKGIYYLEKNGISTDGVKQVSSHYSCDSCRDTQKSTGVMNYTGYASENRNRQKRIPY